MNKVDACNHLIDLVIEQSEIAYWGGYSRSAVLDMLNALRSECEEDDERETRCKGKR